MVLLIQRTCIHDLRWYPVLPRLIPLGQAIESSFLQWRNRGYDKGTSVGVTAASPPRFHYPSNITMVCMRGYALTAQSTGACSCRSGFPGILLGLAMMAVVKYYSKRRTSLKM